MFQLHPDENFHYETIRSLGVVRYHGGDVGEQIAVLQNIPAGDFEAWYREWSNLAQAVISTIDQSRLEDYSPVTIRDVYFRASHYQFVADFFIHGNPLDHRLRENYQLWTTWFDIANAQLPIPGQKISISTKHGFTVPARFYRTAVASASDPRPALLIHGGFDSNVEEVLHVFGFAALERNYNVVIFEGPGQLGVVHEQGKGWNPKWEEVVTPLVDHICNDSHLAYIDTSKIGLIGMSLGGVLAARAAAFEPRLAAVVLIDGVWSFEDCMLLAMPDLKDAWMQKDRHAFNKLFLSTNSDSSTGRRWITDHLMFSSQMSDPFEVTTEIVAQMNIKHIAYQINMPAFVGLARDDIFFKGQPEKVAEAIGANASLLRFDADKLAAGAHCASGALTYRNQAIFEWFAKIVGR